MRSQKAVTIFDFWMRYSGSGLKLFRLQRFQELSLSKSLVCFLVQGNRTEAQRVLSTDPQLWLLEFLGLLQDEALAGFAWSKLHEIGLASTAESIHMQSADAGAHATFGVWPPVSLLKNLQRSSAIEQSRFDDFDDKFVEILDAVKKTDLELVWPKGISLARSLYQEPHWRWSGDFDLICRREGFAQLFHFCSQNGYEPIRHDPGFCNQLEVGPTDSAASLFCLPCDSLAPSAVVGFRKLNWPLIDPKFNPIDRGMRFREEDRFYSELLKIEWRGRTFFAPSTYDHLLLSLVHFEKARFSGWKSMLDIHHLCQQIDLPSAWMEFVRRCKYEGLELSAWSGLSVVIDRFHTPVPGFVLEELSSGATGVGFRLSSFVVEPLFCWNGASVLALILNALFTGDTQRKLIALSKCAWPTTEFLNNYYCKSASKTNLLALILLIPVQLLVLALPALAIRRSFGWAVWPQSHQYDRIS